MFGNPASGEISSGRLISLKGYNILSSDLASGEYFCFGCTNTPGGADGYLSARRVSAAYAELTWRNYDGSTMQATQINGTWGAWVPEVTTSDLDYYIKMANSGTRYWTSLVKSGSENRIYFYSDPNPTAANNLGYITLT